MKCGELRKVGVTNNSLKSIIGQPKTQKKMFYIKIANFTYFVFLNKLFDCTIAN